jgi:hypothetical protein
LSNVPDSIFKRDVLFGAKKVTPAQLKDFAMKYEQAHQLSDAIDFYAQAQSQDDLKRLAQQVVKEGDTFFFLKINRLLGGAGLGDELLKACGDRARELQKHRYAILAYEKLGLDADAAAIRDSIKDDGDIKAAAEQDVFISSHQDEIEGEADETVTTTKTTTRTGG